MWWLGDENEWSVKVWLFISCRAPVSTCKTLPDQCLIDESLLQEHAREPDLGLNISHLEYFGKYTIDPFEPKTTGIWRKATFFEPIPDVSWLSFRLQNKKTSTSIINTIQAFCVCELIIAYKENNTSRLILYSEFSQVKQQNYLTQERKPQVMWQEQAWKWKSKQNPSNMEEAQKRFWKPRRGWGTVKPTGPPNTKRVHRSYCVPFSTAFFIIFLLQWIDFIITKTKKCLWMTVGGSRAEVCNLRLRSHFWLFYTSIVPLWKKKYCIE